MNIFIFSDRKSVIQSFQKIRCKSNCRVETLPVKSFAAEIKTGDINSIYYLDISSGNDKDRNRMINSVIKAVDFRTGIIDPDGSIADIAGLFHRGVADYIGKSLLKTGLTLKRLEAPFRYMDMGEAESDRVQNEPERLEHIIPGDDWNFIRQGNEYTFCFMLIELDDFRDMKKRAGAERAKRISDTFHRFISDFVSEINGRIWMWMEYTGLVLIPFNGRDCEAVLASFRLMLNRHLFNSVELSIDYSYSYHIALHIGNTLYRERGETGAIVSDSINSIFHLGQKFAEEGALYLTDSVESYIPAGIRDFFIPAGEFEGRRILRMKKLL